MLHETGDQGNPSVASLYTCDWLYVTYHLKSYQHFMLVTSFLGNHLNI